VSENPPCPQCGKPVAPSSRGGRPKTYCSRACTSRAAYERERGAPLKRRPLPDFARDAGWSLRKDVERLERILADDRYPQYRLQVAAHLRGHLEHAAEVCQDLLSQLNQTGE
jgi:hypothetical protein